MVHRSSEGSLGDELGALIGRAAVGAVVAAALLLGLGLIAEILRRRRRAHRVLAILDLTLPTGVRTAVVALLALIATFTGPAPVGAADSVRGWLGHVNATTTTTRAVVATPDAVSERTPTPPLPTTPPPTGTVVLIPPVTVERVDPTSPPARSGAAAPAVAQPQPTASGRSYVVQRGDCLWSIAAGVLGPAVGASAIDAAWRQIYAANRVAIGDNPNLIHIGLALELPPLVTQP
jgi:hypothetical protein